MNRPYKITHSIGDASKITGVSQKQIRNWETCKYIPKAERIVCGERAYRRFTQDQVNVIREIKEYLDQGYTLKHASRLALNKEGGVKNA